MISAGRIVRLRPAIATELLLRGVADQQTSYGQNYQQPGAPGPKLPGHQEHEARVLLRNVSLTGQSGDFSPNAQLARRPQSKIAARPGVHRSFGDGDTAQNLGAAAERPLQSHGPDAPRPDVDSHGARGPQNGSPLPQGPPVQEPRRDREVRRRSGWARRLVGRLSWTTTTHGRTSIGTRLRARRSSSTCGTVRTSRRSSRSVWRR